MTKPDLVCDVELAEKYIDVIFSTVAEDTDNLDSLDMSLATATNAIARIEQFINIAGIYTGDFKAMAFNIVVLTQAIKNYHESRTQ